MLSSVVTVPLHCNSVGGSVFGTHHRSGGGEYHCVTAKNVEREMHVADPFNVDT